MLHWHSPHSASTRMEGNCMVSLVLLCTRITTMLIVFHNKFKKLLMNHGQSADTENYQRKVSKFEFIEMKIEIFSVNSDTDTLLSCMHFSFLCLPSMVQFQCYHIRSGFTWCFFKFQSNVTWYVVHCARASHLISPMHFSYWNAYAFHAFMCHWYCEMSYRRNKVRRKYFRSGYFILDVSCDSFHPDFEPSTFFHTILTNENVANRGSRAIETSFYSMSKCIEENWIDMNSPCNAKRYHDWKNLEMCCWSHGTVTASHRYSLHSLPSFVNFLLNAFVFPYCKWILEAYVWVCVSRFTCLEFNSNELWIFVAINYTIHAHKMRTLAINGWAHSQIVWKKRERDREKPKKMYLYFSFFLRFYFETGRNVICIQNRYKYWRWTRARSHFEWTKRNELSIRVDIICIFGHKSLTD